jgi:uncharacterized protein
MSRAPLQWRFAVLFCALAAVSGCSSPAPALYTLAPLPGTPIDRPFAPVALRTVGVAEYLDRPQIVHHKNVYELAMSDTVRWGEAIDEMVPRVLREDLEQRLPNTPIAAGSSGMVPGDSRVLSLDIDRFDADPDGTVVLEARWTLRSGTQEGRVRTTRVTVAAGSTKTVALVAAMSSSLAQLSDQLAQALANGG